MTLCRIWLQLIKENAHLSVLRAVYDKVTPFVNSIVLSVTEEDIAESLLEDSKNGKFYLFIIYN